MNLVWFNEIIKFILNDENVNNSWIFSFPYRSTSASIGLYSSEKKGIKHSDQHNITTIGSFSLVSLKIPTMALFSGA